jgi:hypothetical protein
MANYSAAARTRAIIAGKLAAQPASASLIPFTLADWKFEQALREALDTMARTKRWCLHIAPPDGVSRMFIMRGTHESVTRRAHQIFGEQTRVLAIEPAPEAGAEVFSNRLHSSGET